MAKAPESRDDLILRTKLHRRPVTEDLVCRKRLLERMDLGQETPLTLVSAPAGYGKSMLVSPCSCVLTEPFHPDLGK